MSKEYYVTMPLAGAVTITVEANSEEEAKEKFYDEYEKTKGLDDPNVDFNWDFHEKMHQGNVAHYEHWEVDVEEA